MYLSIDSSNNLLSISLFNQNKLIDSIFSDNKNQQTSELFSFLDKLLNNNNLTIHDIKEIIVSVGPGSFTGIRVALAATSGIKIASNIKISGMTNFQSFAFHAQAKYQIQNNFTVILEANRGEYYCQEFNDKLFTVDEPALIPADHITNIKNIASSLTLKNNSYPINIEKNNSVIMAEAFFYYKKLNLLHQDMPLYIRNAVS